MGATDQPPSDFPLGDRYEVGPRLGAGGMGLVYAARDRLTQTDMAIKILRQELQFSAAAKNRFLVEAKISTQLAHPNIVRVHDVGIAGGYYYLTMERLRGQTLRDRLTSYALENRTHSIREVTAIADQLIDALVYAHANLIIHRDIKPANVWLSDDGPVKLMDFGIAHAYDNTNQLTQTGMQLGTAYYMAPEQRAGQPLDWRADQYALGVLMFEMLTGLPPMGTVRPLERTRADIPKRYARAVMRAMEIVPGERWSSLEQLRKELIQSQAASWISTVTSFFSPSRKTEIESAAPTGASIARQARDRPAPVAANAHTPPDATRFETSDQARIASLAAEGFVDAFGSDATIFNVLPGAKARGAIPVALVVVSSSHPGQIGRRFPLDSFPCVVGRAADANVTLADDGVSRQHVRVERSKDGFIIVDLKTTNGSFLNGRRIVDTQALLLNDIITLSRDTTLRFVADLPTTPDLTGQVLDGRYELQRRVHWSAKAATYEASDRRIPRIVAIKVLSPGLTGWAHYRDEFRRQAEIAARLNHPHICTTLDSGEAGFDTPEGRMTAPYICMAWMAGGDLSQRLGRGAPVEPQLMLRWARTLGGALELAHNAGVTHGGLKPSAIVFDQHDTPYLTDFALANSDQEREVPRALLGAPAFLSPEQWEGGPATPASDQYSLATLLYLSLSGSRPFEGQSDPDVRRRNFEVGPQPVHLAAKAAGREIPPALSEVLGKALAPNPRQRYATIVAFVDAIEATLTSTRHAGGPPRIFLSYQRESSAGWAVLLARELKREHDIQSFVDTEQRDGAGRFHDRLKRAIDESDAVVCLLAADTLRSEWVRQEIRFAFENNKPMIPVFQESYRDPGEAPDESVQALLAFDGVHLLDRKNIHINHTISDLASLIRGTTPR